jgi:hypothetical protein
MDDEAGRWMTFAELSALRGTTKRAAVMLVRRHGWRRMNDNQGRVIAFIPATWAEAIPRDVAREPPLPPLVTSSTEASPFHAAALAALEDALSALREAHARELSLLREAHQGETSVLQERVALTETRLAEAAAALRSAEVALEQAQEGRQEAVQALDQIRRADDARKARGRIRRAWDGWRGR